MIEGKRQQDMETSRYIGLQRKIILITLVVSLAPLIVLGATIYYQFAGMYRAKIIQQITYRSRGLAQAVELFLKERTAILCSMADTHHFNEMIDEANLLRTFEIMNSRAGAFVDLGVIDGNGRHLAYIGPYDLKGLNYYQQPWFGEVMAKGVYISDVYMGYRKLPHFIIAVRRQEKGYRWILRATIDSGVFEAIVKAAQVGKTGDAFIVNKSGVYQTQPRFEGRILTKSKLETSLFGGNTTVIEKKNSEEKQILFAGTWINHGKWLVVIRQGVTEEMTGLFSTRNMEIAIVLSGILAIILMTVFTTRMTISRLRAADVKASEMNAQLMQSDKLAALGKMAAGIAHEINNPLQVIVEKTGWMKDLLDEEELEQSENIDEFRTSINKIEEHVERARKVVHGMLGFARKMEPHMEDVDINAVINQTRDFLGNYARINNITITSELSPDLPIVAADGAQLQQVFMNLVSNAIDAIGKDGRINIKSWRMGPQIHIEVSDNGPGIPEEKQKRIFDPFFTTKETGKGIGLGLWVTHNIVEKMGGAISMRSEEGKGTTFTVRIPIVIPEKK